VVFHSRFPPITSPQAGIFTRRIFREIYCAALDKRKKGFPKLHTAPSPVKNFHSP
jgi:hypothetical protein